MKLICFKHPSYKGNGPPLLSCRSCCRVFLDEVKRRQEATGDISVLLADNPMLHRSAPRPAAAGIKSAQRLRR